MWLGLVDQEKSIKSRKYQGFFLQPFSRYPAEGQENRC